MTFNHSVSDLVARIRNGYLSEKLIVSSPVSKLRESILQILKNEGYILSYSKVKNELTEKFDIHLKYYHNNPVVSYIEVVSKPGKRVYANSKTIPLVRNGLGVVIISTSKGVIPDHEARANGVGGEILLKIF